MSRHAVPPRGIDSRTRVASSTDAAVDADAPHGALLATILDAAPDPVVAIDCTRRVRYANPACAALFGTTLAYMVGRHVTELVRPGKSESEVGADGARRGHVEIELRNGERRWIAFSANTIDPPDASDRLTVAYLRDETERRRNELHLSLQSDEREQTLRALAHDLRSPLVSVLGFSRLLRDEFGAALGERGTHFLERIGAAGRTMEQLICDLLEFSRIGHDGEQPTSVDPLEVLQQLRAELKPRLEQLGVELVLPELPPSVRCDRTRLYQLLSNLIGNALDHMGPQEAARITVEIAQAPDRHEIVVCDNGRGVAPEQRERVFEMFHSVAHAGGRKGSGIGLAIVRKIAELHGGRAFCDEAPEGGAAFHVVLPR